MNMDQSPGDEQALL
jgi:peptidoglycan/LPS O-acetylase OafA/YrhL